VLVACAIPVKHHCKQPQTSVAYTLLQLHGKGNLHCTEVCVRVCVKQRSQSHRIGAPNSKCRGQESEHQERLSRRLILDIIGHRIWQQILQLEEHLHTRTQRLKTPCTVLSYSSSSRNKLSCCGAGNCGGIYCTSCQASQEAFAALQAGINSFEQQPWDAFVCLLRHRTCQREAHIL
jgi:hypothetical protein